MGERSGFDGDACCRKGSRPVSQQGVSVGFSCLNLFTHFITLCRKGGTMWNQLLSLLDDESGFIVSSEVVLIGTITVLGMIVGLSEVAFNVNRELGDVAAAFGNINQGYHFSGAFNGQAGNNGSQFQGGAQSGQDLLCDAPPRPEN